LVRLKKKVSAFSGHDILPLGSLGLVIAAQEYPWGGCDHKIHFQSHRFSMWVYNDEIELVDMEKKD